MLISVYFWLFKFTFIDGLRKDAFDIVFCSMFGSLGSLLSISYRNDQFVMDATAGSSIHRLEAIARITVGIIGALFVALLLKANFVLTFLNDVNNKTALLIAFSILAGASERFVPNMVKKIEDQI